MSQYRNSNRCRIGFVLGGTYGSDPGSGSAQLIVVEDTPQFTPFAGQMIERNPKSDSFGQSVSVMGADYGTLSFDIAAVGSGVAGTAPYYGDLFLACNMAETVTAAPITGTAQAGGSTTSIKLASGASATDNFYVGMSVSITSGTGNGQSGNIVAYNGTSKIATVDRTWTTAPDGTSAYSIGANVLYTPTNDFSTDASTFVDLYYWLDGVKYRMLGAKGSVKYSWAINTFDKWTFTFTGLRTVATDAALPTFNECDFQTPLACFASNTHTYLHGIVAKSESVSMDLANDVQFIARDEMVLIGNRKPMGDVNMEAGFVADKDWMATIRASGTGDFAHVHGVAGNQVGIFGTRVQITNMTPGENQNMVMDQFNLSFARGCTGEQVRFVIK